jgi:predicted nucleic acid-binding Zn ribbon protein
MSNYVGLVYEYQCREHGTSNPIVIFRNLRYLHLCPKCKREMKKVYVKTVKVYVETVTGGTEP